MKFSYIAIFFVVLMSCGTNAKLKYAQKLYDQKSYAEAAKVCESIKDDSADKNKLLAMSNFQMLKMDKAAEAFAKVGDESMSAEEKLMYSEALKQAGSTGESVRVASAVSEGEGGKYVVDYQNPLLEEPLADIKVYAEENSTMDDEMTPFYYLGGMFYLSNHQTKFSPNQKFAWNGKPFMQIMDTAGTTNHLFKSLNTKMHDGPVTIAEDLGLMVINRNVQGKRKTAPHLSLFQKKTSTIKNAKSEELPFCKDGASYAHPFFNGKSNKLFFSSNRSDSKGGMDVYYAELNDDGSWGEPMAIQGSINTDRDEVYPTLLTDSILVFASNRPSGYGGLDLYSCYMNRDGSWSEPKLLDLPLNSTKDDFYLINDPETTGKYFFTTNRDGNDNIYSAFIPNTLAGDWEVQIANNSTEEILRGLPVKIQYELSSIASEDLTTDDAGVIEVNANGGVINVVADGYKQAQLSYAPPKHAYFRSVRQTLALTPVSSLDVNGKVKDAETQNPIDGVLVKIVGPSSIDTIRTNAAGQFTQGVDLKLNEEGGVYDIELSRPGYAPKKIKGVKFESSGTQLDLNALCDLSLKKIEVGDDLGALLAIKPIYFETAKWDITAQGAEELDKIADILLSNPDFKIECGSHTDCRGNKNANLTLSSKRANSTVKYLMSKGITPTQLKYKGYGEDQPVNDCRCEGAQQTTCSEEELALNRRTEFKVLQKDETNDVAPTVDPQDAVTDNGEENSSEPKVITGGTDIRVEGEPVTLLDPLTEDKFEYGVDVTYQSSESISQNKSLPAGKLYMVQVGAFREEIDVEIFNGMEPVYAEKTKSGLTRYCVGMFTSYSKAEAAMQVLHNRGFKDAFIVGYKEGDRVPVQSLDN